MNWRYCCDTVMIKHNNQELQDKLAALGYYPLRWSVCDEKRQKLIAKAGQYVSTHGDGASYNNPNVYPGCFWNGGIIPVVNPDELGPRGETIYCGDDEDMFLMYAERLMKEKGGIYFDKDKNEVKRNDK